MTGQSPVNYSKKDYQLIKAIFLLILFLCLFFSCDDFSFYREAENRIDDDNTGEPGSLEISPVTIMLYPLAECTFKAINGTPPYTFSIFGYGTIDQTTGRYTAPDKQTNDVILLTDAEGNTDVGSAIVTDVLSLSPASLSLEVNNKQTFTVSGGIPPYTFEVVSGEGSIVPFDSDSGEYTASDTPGNVTVSVTDNVDNTAEAYITVVPVGTFIINPPQVTLTVGEDFTFTASGGKEPYTYSIVSGPGEIVGAIYTATGSGIAIVRVTDSDLKTDDATVTVNDAGPLTISPPSIEIAINKTYPFTACGGQEPYVFSVTQGKGTIDPVTGLYTAPDKQEVGRVMVEDNLGSKDTANVTVRK
jgi:hypothetical protein